MEPEIYFLKYAIPCMEWKAQLGKVSYEDFKKYRKAASRNEKLSRELLERIYPVPLQIMRDIAQETKKELWSDDVIAEFYLIRHNQIIDDKKYGYGEMPMLDELCKVYKAKLIKFIPIKNSLREPMALAEYNHRIRPVSIILVPGAQLGELVTIHQGNSDFENAYWKMREKHKASK